MSNSKKKGNKGEHLFASILRSHGFAAYKNSSSGGGVNKSDIHNSMGINWEVKTVKKINLLKCWRQTDRDSSMARSMPMLAIRFDGMRENEFLIVSHIEDWIEMYKKSLGEKVVVKVQEENRNLRYKVERLILAGKEVLKELSS